MKKTAIASSLLLLCVSNAYCKVTYLHSNPLGSIVAATDETGKQLWVKRYTPYGTESEASGTVSDLGANHSYATHEVDKETGLVYMKARFYDPLVGRFLSRDPIEAGSNFYAYANSGPLSAFDPDGKEAIISGGNILINPYDQTVPAISIPNIPLLGATGFKNSEINFHYYNVVTPTMLDHSYLSDVGRSLASNPTPGPDSMASPMGTLNNAGYILPWDIIANNSNMVMSFSVSSPDPARFSDITVNYTVAGQHGIAEGFVMRYGYMDNGSVTYRSYGEGNSAFQNMNLSFIWNGPVQSTWQSNHMESMNWLDSSSGSNSSLGW